MHVSRQMLQEEAHPLVNSSLFDHLIIIQNEHDGGGRGGGWGDSSSATAVSPKLGAYPPPRRRAAISATQKRVGLVSSSSSESQATCAGCRRAQAESSVVLPKPAGAESRVSGVASAPSSAESKGSRSTSTVGKRGGASRPESTSIPWSSACAGFCSLCK